MLYMMDRRDLLPIFVAAGLRDESLPYHDRRSFPPRMSKNEPEACARFIKLQEHVLSDPLAMEQFRPPGYQISHAMIESGDLIFKHVERLGRGGSA